MEEENEAILYYTNTDKGENAQMVQHIVHFLEEKDCFCSVMENKLWLAGNIRHFTDVTKLSDQLDCVIVLGWRRNDDSGCDRSGT